MLTVTSELIRLVCEVFIRALRYISNMTLVFREQYLDELNAAADSADSVADVADALASASLQHQLPNHARTLGDWYPGGGVAASSDAQDAAASVLQAAAAIGVGDQWPRLESNHPPAGSSRDWEQHAWQLTAWMDPATTVAAVGTSAQPRAGSEQQGRQTDRRHGPARRSLPHGLGSALKTQEQAMSQHKLRGATRRAIGKHSRGESHDRARRLAPLAACGAAEAAARRGRHAESDARLAHLLGGSLSMNSLPTGEPGRAARGKGSGAKKRGAWRVIH